MTGWLRKSPHVYRTITLEQLEDRIVLDAGGGSDAHETPDGNDNSQQQTQDAEVALESGSGVETSTATAQPDDPLAEVFEQDFKRDPHIKRAQPVGSAPGGCGR